MKIPGIIILLLLIPFSCKSMAYKFIQEYHGDAKNRLKRRLGEEQLFPNRGVIEGLYVEKAGNFSFTLTYSISEEFYDIKIYTLSGDSPSLHCVSKEGIISFPQTGDLFLTRTGRKLLECFQLIVTVYPGDGAIYRTNDDYYIITDGKNFYKYEERYIVKKENKQYTINYRYSDDRVLEIIEFADKQKKYLLKIERIGESE